MFFKKKFLIWVTVILTVLLLSGCSSTEQENAEQQEEEIALMIDVMSVWANGGNYESEYPENWEDVDYPEVEENALEIVQSLKSDPQMLSWFLFDLEQVGYCNQKIYDEVKNISLTFEEKLELRELDYYSLPRLTKSDLEEYIAENGTNELHTTPGTGGYYDGKENNSYHHDIGFEGSPLYYDHYGTYSGDFYYSRETGVDLNEYYEEESYIEERFFFKDEEIKFDPRDYDCCYSGIYLFAFSDKYVYIYNVEEKNTEKFVF